MEVDDIQQLLGGYKQFQILAYFLLSLIYARGVWHVFSPMYLGFTPGHHCAPWPNTTLNESLPWDQDTGTWDSCKIYKDTTTATATVPCQHGWVYDLKPDETSFVAEWDLVCDKGYLVELSTTIYMVGTTCGALLLTRLSDVFGRKKTMLGCLWVQAVLGFGLAWVHDLIAYTAIRFFIGLMNMTIALCAYVLMSESFPSTHRLLPAVSIQFFWAMGMMLLSLFGYLIRNWRHLEMLISLPNVLTVIYVWLLSESVPWLVSQRKVDEAESVLQRAARMNKISLPTDIRVKLEEAADVGDAQHKQSDSKEKQTPSQSQTVAESCLSSLQLLVTPKINIYCFVMFFLFLSVSLGYFGIIFMTPALNGDRFFNLFLSATVEIPAYIIAYVANKFIGRRIPECIFLLICAAGNISAVFVPAQSADGSDLTWLKTTLVMIGKFGITGGYSTLYLLGAEIFPTSVRNHALGMASFFENIGSMAAPFMLLAAKRITYLPLSIFGGLTAIGGLLVLLLPETHGRPLPQTVEEVQTWGRKKVDNKKKKQADLSGKDNPSYDITQL